MSAANEFDVRICDLRHESISKEILSFKHEIIARFDRLEESISRHDGQGERIARLEESMSDIKAMRLWIIGAIGGAVVSVILSVVLKMVG